MKSSEWQLVGKLSDIPVLGARRIRVGRVSIGLFRTSDDELFALEDSCPHLGGPISEGIVHGKSVTCPLHNLVIDLKTGKSIEPTPQCVRICSVQREGEDVYLNPDDLLDVSQSHTRG